MERLLGCLPRRPTAHPSLRVFVASALLVSAVGCRGPAPADVVGSQAANGQDWYCEPAGEGGWQCIPNVVQPARAATPEPVDAAPPMPAEEQAPVPVVEQPPAVVQQPPPPAVQQPRPPVVEQPRPTAPAVPSADLPLYVRLAHRLDGIPLLELPSDYYAVQLFAALSRAKVEELAVDSGLEGMAGARVERDGKIFYVLLAGVYADQERAERAERSLPPNIRALRPWVRSLGGLQASMRRADALLAQP